MLGADNAPGDYLARVKVCNVFTKRCLVAESPFRVPAEAVSGRKADDVNLLI